MFIGVVAMLTFIFINVFEPYGIYQVHDGSILDLFLEINIAILAAVSVLIFTQFFLREAVKIKSFTYLTFIPWSLLDMFLITLLWTVLTILIDNPETNGVDLFVTNMVECVLLVLPCYVVGLLFIGYKDQNKTATNLNQIIEDAKVNPDAIIALKEKSGKEKISLRLADVLFFESDDNYVNVHYLEGTETKKYVLRNTIKHMEQALIKYNIVRCHRGYLVNMMNVLRIEKQSRKGFRLILKGDSVFQVPVSRQYVSEIHKLFA